MFCYVQSTVSKVILVKEFKFNVCRTILGSFDLEFLEIDLEYQSKMAAAAILKTTFDCFGLQCCSRYAFQGNCGHGIRMQCQMITLPTIITKLIFKMAAAAILKTIFDCFGLQSCSKYGSQGNSGQ